MRARVQQGRAEEGEGEGGNLQAESVLNVEPEVGLNITPLRSRPAPKIKS